MAANKGEGYAVFLLILLPALLLAFVVCAVWLVAGRPAGGWHGAAAEKRRAVPDGTGA